MNEQDTAAADAILLMEAEEKVKLRILEVIIDVVHNLSLGLSDYKRGVSDTHYDLQRLIKETIKDQL